MVKKGLVPGILVLWFLSFALHAQECTFNLTVVIRDQIDSSAISGAEVFLVERRQQAITNSEGLVQFRSLCSGNYLLMLHEDSHGDSNYVIVLRADTVLYLIAPEHAEHLHAVTVTGIRHKEADPGQSFQVIEAEALQQNALSSYGELLDKAGSNIRSERNGPAVYRPQINGFSGNRLSIITNGLRKEAQQWGNEHPPEEDPMSLERITIITASAAVQYGPEAQGGAILNEPVQLDLRPGIRGSIRSSVQTVNRGGGIAGEIQAVHPALPNLGIQVQGNLKGGGNYKTPDYYLDNTGTRDYHFMGRSQYRHKRSLTEVYYQNYNSTYGVFSGAHIGNLTDLEAAIGRDQPLSPDTFLYAIASPYQTFRHEVLQVRHKQRIGLHQNIELNVGRQFNFRQEWSRGRNGEDRLYQEYNLRTLSARGIWSIQNHSGFMMQAGLEIQGKEQTIKGADFLPNYYQNQVGIFALHKWHKKQWHWEYGARLEWRELQSFYYRAGTLEQPYRSYVVPAFFGALMREKGKQEWKLSATYSKRPPGIHELFSNGLHHGTAALEYGEVNLNPEYSANLSFSGKHKGVVQDFGAEAFFYYMPGYINLTPQSDFALTIRGAFPIFRYVQTDALIYGLSLTHALRIQKRFEIRNQGGWALGYDISQNEALFGMPSFRFKSEWSLLKGLPIGEKQHLFPFLGIIATATKKQVPEEGDYMPPPKGYGLLNAGVRFERQKESAILWNITFKVENILNAAYRDYLDRLRYYADAPGRNISLLFIYFF